MGGNHVCAQGIDTQTWLPQFLIFIIFLEFPQPEAHKKKKISISPARSTQPPNNKAPTREMLKIDLCKPLTLICKPQLKD